MFKEKLIYDQEKYLKLKRVHGKVDLYFNLKNNSNEQRGHAVIISGAGAYSTISLPKILRPCDGIDCTFTIGCDGIYLNFENQSWRF